jgi:hypothetical protein
VGIFPRKQNILGGMREMFTTTNALSAYKVNVRCEYDRKGGECGRGRASAFHLFTSASHARDCSLQALRSLNELSRSSRRTRRSSSA